VVSRCSECHRRPSGTPRQHGKLQSAVVTRISFSGRKCAGKCSQISDRQIRSLHPIYHSSPLTWVGILSGGWNLRLLRSPLLFLHKAYPFIHSSNHHALIANAYARHAQTAAIGIFPFVELPRRHLLGSPWMTRRGSSQTCSRSWRT
jgi:hypothetical protein